jgi:two-component system catabolic regulation response regulator CreB
VLVVEDDAGIADAVVYALERDGIAAAVAPSLASARAFDGTVDLAVLDLGLPDGSGFTLLHEWRARGGPAVIVLTSRDGETDCVASLEAGADDFVAKPFSVRALIARVRAVLRRGSHPRETQPRGSLRLDAERRTATFDGRPLALTKTEFDLLAILARAPGRVYTREQLVTRVWGDGYALEGRTIDTHVKALRRKLAEVKGEGASLIEAVRGVGFRLREAP